MDFDLSKRHCWYFHQISRIPRGSRNEKAVSDYICSFAKEHGLPYRQDAVYNVMIDKPASKGYEDSPSVILQAHIDMVCEKNEDVVHDFEKDPLDLYTEDGWLKARGTTLGADDGFGVAYMLAILEDETIPHPPLECIFTVQEEIGLLGAAKLKAADLHGHRYISLDGGGGGVCEISCAGAQDAYFRLKAVSLPSIFPMYELSVRGLLGGHSGGKIHMERGNANLIACRILKEIQRAGYSVTLSDLRGGQKENAIPREAFFRFVCNAPYEELHHTAEKSAAAIRSELQFSDPGAEITLRQCEEPAACFPQEVSDRLLNFIFLMPHGYLHHSMAVEGLTTVSLNLGVIRWKEDRVEYSVMIRAAEDSARKNIAHRLSVLADLLGMEQEFSKGYPGWAYTKESELRKIMKQAVEEKGLRYEEIATHGGLECGLIRGLDPMMDIITLGPVVKDIHSPEERMNLKSFDDMYEVLRKILENCR